MKGLSLELADSGGVCVELGRTISASISLVKMRQPCVCFMINQAPNLPSLKTHREIEKAEKNEERKVNE